MVGSTKATSLILKAFKSSLSSVAFVIKSVFKAKLRT